MFVLCAPEVPCGKFGAAALTKAGVTAKPASLEENVKAVVSKVTLGEADAGIVYVTDVKAAGDKAQGVDIDIADDPTLEAVYPIAVTKQAANVAGGQGVDRLRAVRRGPGDAGRVRVPRAVSRRPRPPILALAVGGVAAAFFLLPLAGLAWRAPWSSFWSRPHATQPPGPRCGCR